MTEENNPHNFHSSVKVIKPTEKNGWQKFWDGWTSGPSITEMMSIGMSGSGAEYMGQSPKINYNSYANKKIIETTGQNMATPVTTRVWERGEINKEARSSDIGGTLDPDGTVLRYPASPAIRSDSDYVLMTFFKYLPPAQQSAKSGQAVSSTSKDLGEVNGTPTTEITTTKERYLNVYNNTSTVDGASTYERTDEKQIMLYMPEDLSTGYKANWNGKALSTAGRDALAAAAAEGWGNKIQAAGSAVTASAQRLGAHFTANTVRGTISSITGDVLTNDEVFGAIGGVVVNPNTELLFNNIDMRTFSLKWKLVPRNAEEAAHVREIIKTLKRSMLPGTSVDKVFGVSFNSKDGGAVEAGFISVPDLVKVAFMEGSSAASYLPQYKMCAITQVDVNYTPDGSYAKTVGADGSVGGVVATELQVSFQETKLVYKEEVDIF